MNEPKIDDAVRGGNSAASSGVLVLGGQQGFEKALQHFVEKLQEMVNKHSGRYEYLKPNKISVDPNGKKYLRIITTRINNDGSEGQRSVHCFINMENGDILKSKSWKAPDLKNPRGNIYSPDCMKAVTVHGAVYLK